MQNIPGSADDARRIEDLLTSKDPELQKQGLREMDPNNQQHVDASFEALDGNAFKGVEQELFDAIALRADPNNLTGSEALKWISTFKSISPEVVTEVQGKIDVDKVPSLVINEDYGALDGSTSLIVPPITSSLIGAGIMRIETALSTPTLQKDLSR